MPEAWPFKLPFLSLTFSKVNASRSGGRSLSNSAQSVVSPSGFWRAEATIEVPSRRARGEDRTLAYRAMYAALNGGGTDIDVPCVAPWRPYDRNGRMIPAGNAAGVDGRSLFDHAGFATVEPVLVTSQAAAPLRSTRMILRHPGIEPLRPGHYFGITNRLYLISHAWQLDYERPGSVDDLVFWGIHQAYFGAEVALWEDSVEEINLTGENVQIVNFWPPLREAAPINTPLTLGRPLCKMHLADDGQAIAYNVNGMSTPTLVFEETV